MTKGKVEKYVEPINVFKLRVFSAMSIIGTLAFLSAYLFNRPPDIIGEFHKIIFSVYTVIMLLFTIFIQFQPQWLNRASWLLYGTTSLYMIIYLDFALYAPLLEVQRRTMLFPLLPWISVVSILCFTFFENRAAIWSAFAYYVAIAGSAIFYLVINRATTDDIFRNDFLQAFVFSPLVYIATMMIISKIKEIAINSRLQNVALQQMAFTDELTELGNRRFLTMIISSELTRYKRLGNPFATMILDLDNFRSVVDNQGLGEGDKILQVVAKILRSTLRSSDWCGRWSSEEFIIIYTSSPDGGFLRAAERLREALNSCGLGGTVPITGSMGLAVITPNDDVDSLIKRAEVALSTAKANGRNRVELAPVT
jgi:diguanylate cyclase (GGDEF)-like protein